MARVYTAGVERRSLGATGLSASAIGFGAGRIGGGDVDDAAVDRLVGAALDAGVTLIDTAPSYGLSEERLGRALAGRREQVVLSTKLGYGVEGVPDWTARCIEAGVDAALRRLRTDRLDLAHLHSCPLEVLERSGVVEALARAVAAGKVRVAAYSGEGEALRWAVRSGAFGAVQCSVSVVDQGALDGAVAEARALGIGVIAKRALGNAPWRFPARPAQADLAESWDRFRALAPDPIESWDRFRALSPDPGALSYTALFARFAAFAPGVSAALVGTASPAHLLEACAAVERGPLDASSVASLRAAFAAKGGGWAGIV